MASGHFLDTPLLYDGIVVNHFIPQEYRELVKIIEEQEREPEFENLEDRLDEVLKNPIGYTESLEQLIKRHYGTHNKILLLVDDNTRPNVHTKILLPLLLPRLLKYGVAKEDIHILFASGTHRVPTPDEQQTILGSEIWKEYQNRLLVHDCDTRCIDLGIKSSMGTPISISEHVMTADIVIPVTDSELHFLAGVAGTIKELVPGIAARSTIIRNHVKVFDKKLGFKTVCRLGNVEGNPMISDLREMTSEIAKRVPIFGVDAIFSLRSKEIVYLNAGDLVKLHEEAVKRVVALRTVEVEGPADLVIVSAQQLGLNLYQTGKAIHTAWYATKQGGTGKILVLAACRDGVGSETYQNVMNQYKHMSIDQAMPHFLENYCTEETFQIGHQKLVDLFRMMMAIGEPNIHILTEMNPELLKDTFRLKPIEKLPEEGARAVLRRVIKDYAERGEQPLIYVIPDPGVLVIQKK